VPTTLLFSSISIAKLLDAPVAPAIARVGDAVQYRIRYDNPAASVIARNVIVTDTLPAGLQYVSAIPAATVSGAVLTWTLGDVPGPLPGCDRLGRQRRPAEHRGCDRGRRDSAVGAGYRVGAHPSRLAARNARRDWQSVRGCEQQRPAG